MSVDEACTNRRTPYRWSSVDLTAVVDSPSRPHNEKSRYDPISWDAERESKLRQMHAEGLSAGRISKIFGDCSRNAIIGKLHRLGLRRIFSASASSTATRHAVSAIGFKPSRVAERPKRRRLARLDAEFKAPKVFERPAAVIPQFKPVPLPPRQPESSDIPPPLRVDLLDLRPHMCRWPIGDPRDEDFHFCGRQKSRRYPYCDHHARVAFQPLPGRRPVKEIP